MYTLTLTRDERKAIEWIGNRYRHGTELYECLWLGSDDGLEDGDWDSDKDVTFRVPEAMAWEICEIIEEGLTCFGPELRTKLHSFAEKVV